MTMDTRLDDFVNREARIDWGAAVLAGVIGGAIDWLLSHGIPWFTSGLITPTFMGREIQSLAGRDGYGTAMMLLAQVAVGIGYALVLAPVVTHLRGIWAISLGGLLGLVLYAINFGVFHFVTRAEWSGSEGSVIVSHVVFGMIVAGIYKGIAARKFVHAVTDA